MSLRAEMPSAWFTVVPIPGNMGDSITTCEINDVADL